MRVMSLCLALSLACAGGLTARADMLDGTMLQIGWGDSMWTVPMSTMAHTKVGEIYHVQGSHSTSDWSASWDLELDPDPAISGVVSLTSASDVTEEFSFSVSLPSSVDLIAPTDVIGSFSANLSTNITGTDAEMASLPGMPVTTASLNDVTVFTLADDLLLQAAAGFTGAYGPENYFSNDGPAVSVGDVMKLDQRFTLTPGHTAQIVSTFAIVPEPGTLILFAVTGLTLLRRSRKAL